jgi:hypothetical protein
LTSNLCIDGGYDICAEMYNKSILVPLKMFISKAKDSIRFLSEKAHLRSFRYLAL